VAPLHKCRWRRSATRHFCLV